MNSNKQEIERIEIDLFLEAIYRRSGYDYRNYAKDTIDRRVKQLASTLMVDNVSQLTEMLLHDDGVVISKAIEDFSINVTEMFRDPDFYNVLRTQVIPFLKTFPFIKIWHAGCASGEEVYSLAIVLKEEGLYDRSTIYATDINDSLLDKARAGIYSSEKMQKYTQNYQNSGGKESFVDYYLAQYRSAIMVEDLKKNITFANHNLAIDSVFSEVHLILCRNVLIYFNSGLQNRVLGLFQESLVHNGFLCLGISEGLEFSTVKKSFKCLFRNKRIYQKSA